jgi:hypothetical protein
MATTLDMLRIRIQENKKGYLQGLKDASKMDKENLQKFIELLSDLDRELQSEKIKKIGKK